MQSMSAAAAGIATSNHWLSAAPVTNQPILPLRQFEYGDVTLFSELHEQQLDQTHALLMSLSDDSLLKPLRQMSGMPAPGEDLGGWYHFNPDLQVGKENNFGFAPSCTFGQWVSALARFYAIRKDQPTRERVLRLNRLYAKTISSAYYDNNRFPTYCYDKFVCGLIDSQRYVEDPEAFSILDHTTDTALPQFPQHAVEHGVKWRLDRDDSWTWDESYTISENLFLAYQRGAGARYRDLGLQYLDDEYYDPLSKGQNVFAGRHAYSYVNSLSSAMQAYLTLGSQKHLRAARNAFEMLTEQSFVTGGWGPDELLRAPNTNDIYDSLTDSHASFETPCGSYAHFKLTRYLLRVTRESRYGDSMERVMYNTVLGAKPLMSDGRTFYYSDYNSSGHKFYRADQHWACCSGTLPQVAADYRINVYFRDSDSIWVNLYIPSELRWIQDGAPFVLSQRSEYPFESVVRFEIASRSAREFTLCFRIPAWTKGASISVNGRTQTAAVSGLFASVQRQWNNGDRIELDLPMSLRLEAVDSTHPETAALLFGPLVLFAITENKLKLSRVDMLRAEKTGKRSWQVNNNGEAVRFLPFVEIDDQQYSTYLRVE